MAAKSKGRNYRFLVTDKRARKTSSVKVVTIKSTSMSMAMRQVKQKYKLIKSVR